MKSEPPSSRVGGLQSLHEDVPPAAFCVVCGRIDCDGGCYFENDGLDDEVLPWDRFRTLRTFWQTCARTAEPPESWLDSAIHADTNRALGFAVLVELAAVGSYVVFAYAALAPILFYFDVPLDQVGGVWMPPLVTLGLGAFMVALHVVGAAFLEVLLRWRGAEPQWKTLLTFACYSCGWDLITSPGGLLVAWAVNGWREAWRLLRGATSNPTAACVHYLSHVRRVSPQAAGRLMFIAAVVAVVLGIAASAALLWWVVPEWWHAVI